MKFGSLDKMKITSSGPKYYLLRSGKGLITSLGIKTIRSSKKIKTTIYSIDNVSLKYIFKIITEFEGLLYGGYVRKNYTRMHYERYFYISIHLAKCMMRSNFCIGPVRTQITNTQRMNNSEMSTQKMNNSHVCSLDENEPKM